MKRCSAKPYEGAESYIFVSYCHRDKSRVFPIIEQLAKDGYRVWYDEGIDPGSEWPEIIARHLNGSAICLAFISENSLNSHNCRREINFALLKKKFFISVILESVQMSLGMEMQLSSSQSIFKYTLSSDREFFKKLYDAAELKQCKGMPDNSIIVSDSEDYPESPESIREKRNPFSDKWFVNADAEEKPKEPAMKEKPVAEEPLLKAEEPEPEEKEQEPMQEPFEETEEKACDKKAKWVHKLKREKTGEEIVVDKARFVIGRSEVMADYMIRDNRSISRAHAVLNMTDDVCYVSDNNSLNKTFLNAETLEPDKRYELKDGDVIKVYNEKFIYQKLAQ